MIKNICICGYIYNKNYGDIASDIEKGVSFVDLPKSWVCPFCGRLKESFMQKKVRNFITSF